MQNEFSVRHLVLHLHDLEKINQRGENGQNKIPIDRITDGMICKPRGIRHSSSLPLNLLRVTKNDK